MERVNWKREGYNVGQKVFVHIENRYSEDKFCEAEVSYVGFKYLRIDMNGHEIEFKSSKSISSISWVSTYTVYKSEDEYKETVRLEKEKDEIQSKLTSIILDMDLEKLRKINKFIESL